MDEGERAAAAKSLEELLTIARVAMPAYLYDLDPRVHSASILLDHLRSKATFPATASWDISEGIDRLMESAEAPVSRSEAVVQMIREWLTANGLPRATARGAELR